MITTLSNYLDPRYKADVLEGYDGIVRVAIGGYYGTGTLLYDGKAILTAAHLFNGTLETSTASVYFETASGKQTVMSSSFTVYPNYDTVDSNNDLALVWLSADAPTKAERYELYRESDEINQLFTMVGYGVSGYGAVGQIDDYSDDYVRLMTQNRFDADASTLKASLGSIMGWTPAVGTQLMADFDDGSTTHDAFGSFLGKIDKGVGVLEGMIAPGDSGGPAFIDGKVAGIASYISNLSTYSNHPDNDDDANSSFGEVGAWQRVSAYQQWIDQSIRAHYVNAPTKPEEVQKAVYELNDGISYAYFLLQFTGVRASSTDRLSVDYTTVDGTAKAGSDYITTQGTLVLYPNENQAVIPVEIIGDTTQESDETFYLDVFNPIGGSFGEGVVKLTAVRTIMNDDGIIL